MSVDKAWFLGSTIGSKDCTSEFIEKGIWESGHEDKLQSTINSIKVGDKVAIKSSYTRKNNLPFYANNNYVSTMAIKAIGTVTNNLMDGKTLEVDWTRVEPKKEWYFSTMRETIWKVERDASEWIFGELLDFTFGNKPQDIRRFLETPYWKERYPQVKEESWNYIDFNAPLDFQDLYFSNPQKLKSQISIALKSGKSIILIGPPGTGKSKIAKKIAESYEVDSKMVTAMSDWSSYDTIGGYKPDESGSLYFEEGIFLSSFKSRDGLNRNQWLIIDEINRADIDKAFGPFFSVLSGDDVELGLKDDKRRNIEIIMEENIEGGMEGLEAESNQYIIPRDWRIIGTMNTFDKTSLYEMSYAFMRRFAFIPVAIPKGIDETLVKDFFDLWKIDLDGIVCGQVARLWRVINKYRKLGPAIIEDIGNYIQQGGDFTSALVIYILPQLEGLFEEQIDAFVGELRGLEFIEDQEDLIESVEDLFNISLAGN